MFASPSFSYKFSISTQYYRLFLKKLSLNEIVFLFLRGMKNLVALLFLMITVVSFAQESTTSEDIADCTGATNILQPGSFSSQFTGKGGMYKDLEAYPSLSGNKESNSLWYSFKATYDGRFTMDASVSEGTLQMVVFEAQSSDACEEIYQGKAEIRRLITSKEAHTGLNLITNNSTLYPIDLVAGKYIMICFLTEAKVKSKLDLHVKFEPTSGELQETAEGGKLLDLRKDKSVDALKILLRDVETGTPVVSNMTITGIKDLTGTFQGSDFYITVEKSGKIQIKIDAEGYFFVDKDEPVSAGSDNEVVIWMEPLGEGKSMQIDEIEFYPGSSEFLETAVPKLRRIKDFLALNANVKVEIQGHVHATGENTFAGQKLSEARAKRVMLWLAENGIDKDRMTAVGYGNTVPIYPDAKFAYEEQANRRVEIKVL